MSTQVRREDNPAESPKLVEMSWDPITRIVGSLGIYTKIDFANRKVAECHSTSSIFRGYSIFMQGKDPRDAHFITSRICGICGDNHATCSIYAQNMAYGVKPPALGEWIINLGEAAEYMFDHNIFQENLVAVDYCEQMVRETNPGVLEKANKTEAPHASDHGYRTIGDIMRAFNPFTGELYREGLQVSRYTREKFCLMEGRHVHPSTLYPGGVGTVATIQLFTDYLVRLMKYVELMKKMVPLHDDLFDFFYEALPGYEMVGYRRTLLGCWGSLQDPDVCDLRLSQYGEVGSCYVCHAGSRGRWEAGNDEPGRYQSWVFVSCWAAPTMKIGRMRERSLIVTHSAILSTSVIPGIRRQFLSRRNVTSSGNYSWVMSPRWYDKRTGDYLALDTGGGPLARLWTTALAGIVDLGGLIKATGHSVKIRLPKTAMKPEVEFEWKVPQWSNAIERNRARTYFQAYAAAVALHCIDKALDEIRAGHTKTWSDFTVPKDAIGCGFHEAVRGVLSHHMVIENGKIANYHPYPPTPWNGSVRDIYGTPGPYEDAVQNTPIFEENGPDKFKGVDIMRAVRSFDPCLPCGVHMYLGEGKELDFVHSPTFGVNP